MKVTLSVIKADVGSIGGHTKPTLEMMKTTRDEIEKAIKSGLILDGLTTHTGDDIALTFSHTHGADNADIHQFEWNTFLFNFTPEIRSVFADDSITLPPVPKLESSAPFSNKRATSYLLPTLRSYPATIRRP